MIPINAPCRSRTSVAVDIASSIWLNNFSRRLVVVSAKSSAIIDMRRSYRRNLADVKIADCYQRSKSQKLAINLLSNQSTVTRMLEKPLRCEVSRVRHAMLPRFESRVSLSNRKLDRKSTRLNSSHVAISYAVFCLKKKNQIIH